MSKSELAIWNISEEQKMVQARGLDHPNWPVILGSVSRFLLGVFISS
jgi:hypothetical protein